MNCSNADLKIIASNVDLLQWNSNVKSKSSRNNEKYVANIIDLLIQTSTLEKEKNKDHSWKEVAVKLMQCLWNDSEGKNNENQNAFIAKNVQKLKTFVQLLSKQLQKLVRLFLKLTHSTTSMMKFSFNMMTKKYYIQLSSIARTCLLLNAITRYMIKNFWSSFEHLNTDDSNWS